MKQFFFLLMGFLLLNACQNNNSKTEKTNKKLQIEANRSNLPTENNPIQNAGWYTKALEKGPLVEISTDYGKMKILLYDKTPLHRDNFLKLIKNGFYDGLLFHRVIPGFMIQGGDPDSRNAPAGKMLGGGSPGYTIPAEFVPEYFHKKGALAAARSPSPDKASNGSQFYIVDGQVWPMDQLNNMIAENKSRGIENNISEANKMVYQNIGGTPALDNQYTVFGEVIEGYQVISKIATVPKNAQNRPKFDIKMQIKILTDKD